MISKKEKILRKLRYVGEDGVHSFTLANIFGIRAAARIADLRKEGFEILSRHEKKGNAIGVRYTLLEK